VDNVNAFNESARLISSSEGPIDEFAFKYAEKEYHSTLSSIDYQVGRTGQITPVFKIAPTVIDGATVTNATMHNLAELKDKNPKVGGKVVLKRAGEVIPYIVDVERADKPIAVPEHCPCCAQPLTTKGRLSFCTNKRGCKEQQFQMLCHFVSRHAMDIDGMGPSIIRLLLEKEHLQVPADIYQLTQSTIQALSGYGEKSAKKLIDAINASRAVNVDKFIYALGIDEIGRVSAMKLSEHFKGDIAAIRTATKDQLLAINDFGKVMAEAVVTYFEQQQGLDELLAEVSLHRTALVTSDKYKGQTLVITGSFADKTREDVAQAFIMGGAKVTKSVSKNTTFILVGDNPSQSKLDKAKALGVPRVYEF
jgi:DNA ligase (NAD+)